MGVTIMQWLGNIKDFLIPIILIAASFFIASLSSLIFKKYLSHFAKKTKTELDDKILKTLEKPVFWIILLSGLYLAIKSYKPLPVYAVDKAFTIAAILIGLYVSIKMVSDLISWYTKREERIYKAFAGVKNLLNVIIYVLAIILVLRTLGYDVTALAAGLGIAALAVALAFQSTLSNFFAGIYITAERTVKIGDYVELENGLAGYVEEIGWRSTKIRTLPNNFVVIPNSKLAESIVTDYHAPAKEMAVIIPCGVSYDSDLEKVERITVEVAKKVLKEVEGGVPEFEPFMRYYKFGDSNIEFNVILRVREFVDKFRVTHEFIKELKKAYDKEGIEIAYPCTNVYMRSYTPFRLREE
ncbi:MAG: mechanosensitive ion channel family protein [Candidatus Methanospirareceae archaeon]